MARGINKVILVGNLGKDPEVRYTTGGAAVTNITVATAETWNDKATGEKQERTEWHRVVFFGRLAEIAGEYLKKGRQVYIEGSIRTRKWQDQSGQDRYTTEIVGNEMQMLGSQAGGQSNFAGVQAPAAPQNQNQGGFQQQGQQNQGQQQNQGSQQASNQTPSFDDFDDDIPF